MQDLQIGQRFVTLLLYNCDTGKSRSVKWVENLGSASLKLILLSEFLKQTPLCSLMTTIETSIKPDKMSLFGSEGWQKGDSIMVPTLLLMITTRNSYSRRKFLHSRTHSGRKTKGQESMPQAISVFCCLSPHTMFSLPHKGSDSSDFHCISK